MNASKRFFINGIILASATVVLRAVAVSFNAFVTKTLGSEAVGLFTLVMSVYSLAVIFATSSVNLATVRMTSASLARLEKEGASEREIRRVLRGDLKGCILYSLFFSLIGAFVVFTFSELIGCKILGDARTVLSVKALSLSLPFIAVGSAISGYFTGVRKAYKNALISMIEQFVKIFFITLGLVALAPKGIEYACASVVGGGALGEALSLISDVIFYATDRVRSRGTSLSAIKSNGAVKRAASIAFPVALGSYVRQSLVCAEHIAIPSSLKKYGADSAGALSSYGVLHGMAFPLIFFPASVLNSFSSLLVPEISACVATDDKKRTLFITERVLRGCLVFSFAVSLVFLCFAKDFGISVYDCPEAGRYILLIAPLIPVMYLDTSVDFILKGLGQQMYTMAVNILDALLSLSLVLLLVPTFGLVGYIASVYTVELINCALSLGRLVFVTGLKVNSGWVIRPFAAVISSLAVTRFITSSAHIPPVVGMVFSVIFAAILMRVTGAVTKSDISYIKNAMKAVKNQ